MRGFYLRMLENLQAASLKSLEKKGYIHREPEPGDARRNRVRLTAKGEKAVDDCFACLQRVTRRMFTGFTTEEQAVMRGFYLRMLENLQAASLKSLEKKGYIHREPEPGDARRNRVRLTAKGEKAVDDCFACLQRVTRRMFTGFTTEEQAVMRGFYLRMLENLQAPLAGVRASPLA